MDQLFIIDIPEMFGGGQVRLMGNQVHYREEGVDTWEPIENLGGSVRVTMMSLRTGMKRMRQAHPAGMTTPGISTG